MRSHTDSDIADDARLRFFADFRNDKNFSGAASGRDPFSVTGFKVEKLVMPIALQQDTDTTTNPTRKDTDLDGYWDGGDLPFEVWGPNFLRVGEDKNQNGEYEPFGGDGVEVYDTDGPGTAADNETDLQHPGSFSTGSGMVTNQDPAPGNAKTWIICLTGEIGAEMSLSEWTYNGWRYSMGNGHGEWEGAEIPFDPTDFPEGTPIGIIDYAEDIPGFTPYRAVANLRELPQLAPLFDSGDIRARYVNEDQVPSFIESNFKPTGRLFEWLDWIISSSNEVVNLVFIGHSHGGGSVYDICAMLRKADEDGRWTSPKGYNLIFTCYIDAIKNTQLQRAAEESLPWSDSIDHTHYFLNLVYDPIQRQALHLGFIYRWTTSISPYGLHGQRIIYGAPGLYDDFLAEQLLGGTDLPSYREYIMTQPSSVGLFSPEWMQVMNDVDHFAIGKNTIATRILINKLAPAITSAHGLDAPTTAQIKQLPEFNRPIYSNDMPAN